MRKPLAIIDNGVPFHQQPARLISDFFLLCRWIYSTHPCNTCALGAEQGGSRIWVIAKDLSLSSFLPEKVRGLCLSMCSAINNISPRDWNLLLKRACRLPFVIANVKLLSVPFLISSRVEVFNTQFNRGGKRTLISGLSFRVTSNRQEMGRKLPFHIPQWAYWSAKHVCVSAERVLLASLWCRVDLL